MKENNEDKISILPDYRKTQKNEEEQNDDQPELFTNRNLSPSFTSLERRKDIEKIYLGKISNLTLESAPSHARKHMINLNHRMHLSGMNSPANQVTNNNFVTKVSSKPEGIPVKSSIVLMQQKVQNSQKANVPANKNILSSLIIKKSKKTESLPLNIHINNGGIGPAISGASSPLDDPSDRNAFSMTENIEEKPHHMKNTKSGPTTGKNTIEVNLFCFTKCNWFTKYSKVRLFFIPKR